MHERIVEHGRKVILIRVPSHVGISGDERADEAATEAVTDLNTGAYNSLHSDDLIKHTEKRISTHWQTEWNSAVPTHIRNSSDNAFHIFKHLNKLTKLGQVAMSGIRIRRTNHAGTFNQKVLYNIHLQ